MNRNANSTSLFAGQCRASGFLNGADARFFFPSGVIKDVTVPNRLVICDDLNSAIRVVDIIAGLTNILVSSGLNYPRAISFDKSHEQLLIIDLVGMKQYNFDSQSLAVITDSGSGSFVDGPLSTVKFKDPHGITPLSSNIFLVVDGNGRLRVVNKDEDIIASVSRKCQRTANGPAENCRLFNPRSLLVTDDLIFVGEIWSINTIPCEYASRNYS